MEQMVMKTAESKLITLYDILKKLGRVAVAFSGGVDSALLLAVAHNALGNDAIAITAASNVIPKKELRETEEFCSSRDIRQLIYSFDILRIPEFRSNTVNRCYHCKHALFTGMLDMIAAQGDYILVEGSNIDDQNDYRPGLRALHELKVRSPLKDAGLTKAEIRLLAYKHGLSEWNKPSFACLASRFVYGEEITAAGLAKVEEAEEILRRLSLRQSRVRVHGDLARIEVLPEDMAVVMTNREFIYAKFKTLGFSYISLDLGGYSSGNMNISIER